MFDEDRRGRMTLCESDLLAKTRQCLFRLAGLGKVRRTISLDYILEGQLINLASPAVSFDIQNL